jgi:hypothetical protein
MSQPEMFTATFKALLKEAQFTKEMLGAGATQIRNANYASKGVYFSTSKRSRVFQQVWSESASSA